MAHNNHFFFTQLANLQTVYERKAQSHLARQPEIAETHEDEDEAVLTKAAAPVHPPEQIQVESSEGRIPPKLRNELERYFSSIETLRREFLTTAMAMFGPGFVWLVKNANSPDLRILTTYLAGSPYTAAHWRRQGVDFNTMSANAETVTKYINRSQTGAGNVESRFSPQAPGGTDVIPLLCLNTWEHVWLRDYGIRGKGTYVQHWWETIDWDKVEGLAFFKKQNSFK
ncbi:Manganese/iron superoxide dismutase [Xylariaceae sp. FL1651]|nr:Manganese/iron superoxide dismutase [Xylariaceae sp. FL1651]